MKHWMFLPTDPPPAQPPFHGHFILRLGWGTIRQFNSIQMFLKRKNKNNPLSLKLSVLGPVKTVPIANSKMQSCILHVLGFGTHSNLGDSPEKSAE